MHDFTDYAGRYAHVAKAFSDLFYDFYEMDICGHGKSGGR